MASDPEARLDLTRPRVYGELLSTSVQIFTRHADVLFTLAILLVAPVTLIVDGIWGRLLADGLDAKPSAASQAVSAGLNVLVVLPLMTAAGALLVRGLGRGDAPADVRSALRSASGAFPRVLGALYVAGRVVGQAIAVAVTAVFATLLFYDLQARSERAAVAAG